MPRQVDPEVAADWWSEGNVQARIRDLLVWEGWTHVAVADTAKQEHGVDVEATLGDRRLAVEVKGYAAGVSPDGRMAGRTKATAATNQARQRFSQALLSALTTRQELPRSEIAIGLPDVSRYRSLVAATDDSLVSLGIGVILVREDGTASWYIRPGRRRADDRSDIRRAVRMSDLDREAYYLESNRNMLRMLAEARRSG